MKKPCVLLSGKSVSRDAELIAELQNSAEVFKNDDNNRIITILEAQPIDVIILEVPGLHPGEVEIILQIKFYFPEAKIIFIDGGREVMAKAFEHGVSDAYRKPYRKEMLIERVMILAEN